MPCTCSPANAIDPSSAGGRLHWNARHVWPQHALARDPLALQCFHQLSQGRSRCLEPILYICTYCRLSTGHRIPWPCLHALFTLSFFHQSRQQPTMTPSLQSQLDNEHCELPCTILMTQLSCLRLQLGLSMLMLWAESLCIRRTCLLPGWLEFTRPGRTGTRVAQVSPDIRTVIFRTLISGPEWWQSFEHACSS